MSGKKSYSPIPNSFKQSLRNRERLIGCWCSLGSPITTEILGLAGFDWLVLDAEHGLNEVLSLVPQLMALKGSPSAPLVRPPCNDPALVKRLLDAGFYNFLLPMINSAQEAEAAAKALRYPPQGIRGVSISHRGNMYGVIPDYFTRINDQVCLIAQIESREALLCLDDICSVEGVDALFVGPADLSACLGHLGDPGNPEVQNAIRHVVSVAEKHGKAVGIFAPVESDARKYLELGITMVAVGSDIGILRTGTQKLNADFFA